MFFWMKVKLINYLTISKVQKSYECFTKSFVNFDLNEWNKNDNNIVSYVVSITFC